jgi:hypothetical protein
LFCPVRRGGDDPLLYGTVRFGVVELGQVWLGRVI